MAKNAKSTYAEPILKAWDEFFQMNHDHREIDAQGYMMISAAIGYVADELADIKEILLQKGVK